MYYAAMHHPKITQETFLHRFLSTKIPRRGIQAAAAAVTLPFSQLKLGRRVSGDSPLSLLKRKKEAKKEKNSPTLILYGNASHEDYTENLPLM